MLIQSKYKRIIQKLSKYILYIGNKGSVLKGIRVPLFPSVLFSFSFEFLQNKTEGFPGITFSFAIDEKSLFPSVFSKTEAFQNI